MKRCFLCIILSSLIFSSCVTNQVSPNQNQYTTIIENRRTSLRSDPISNIIINEVCLQNKSLLEYGKNVYPQWVELANISDTVQSLQSYSIVLKDTDGSVKQFNTFPDIVIPPKGFYLLIFSETKTVKFPTSVHMLYTIPQSTVELSLKEGTKTLDSFPLEEHQNYDITEPFDRNYSFARNCMCCSIIQKDLSPTPGLSNATIIDSPVFNDESGFHEEMKVTFDTKALPEGYEIYYTINDEIEPEFNVYTGPESWCYPTPISGKLYTGPIGLKETAVIKARVYSSSGACSATIHRTFLIHEDTDLPIVSIVTEPECLWDPEYGIYIRGSGAEANFLENNLRLIDFSFFSKESSQNALCQDTYLMRIYGAFSRWKFQKSLAIYAKAPASEKRIPNVFFTHTASEVLSFHSIILRNSGGDNERTHFRDGFITGLASDLDVDKQDFQPSIVLINGQYWGIYNIREKINEYFIEDHHGIDPNEIDLIEGSYRCGMEIKEGDFTAIDKLIEFLKTTDTSYPDAYKRLTEQIDIDSFTDYIIIEIFANNTDWPWSNVKFYRPRTTKGKWRFILFDTDEAFDTIEYHTKHYEINDRIPHGVVDFNMLDYVMQSYNADIVSTLFRALIVNPAYYEQFNNRFEELLNTLFTPEHLSEEITTYSEAIMSEITRHIDRWTKPKYKKNSSQDIIEPWLENLQILYSFSRNRKYQVLSHLNLFKTTYNPLAFMGKIRNGDFEIPDQRMWNMNHNPELVFSSIITDDNNHIGYIRTLETGKHYWEAATFIYDSLKFKQGETLELSFDIKSNQPLENDEYVQVSLFDCRTNKSIDKKQICPSTEWQHESVIFTYEGPTITTGRLVFFTGALKEGRELLLDNIRLKNE